MDTRDYQILSLLQENARMTASEMAERLGLSVPTITERIRKLVEGGYIQKFTTKLNAKKLGFDLTAYIAVVSASSEHYEDIVQEAVHHPGVLECHSVTGEGSHLLKVRVRNSSELEQLLREIQAWPGVTRTHTSVVMSTYKEDWVLNLSSPAETKN